MVQCSQVIFLGDLNYRISLPEGTTRLLTNRGEWNALQENDQVTKYTIFICLDSKSHIYIYMKFFLLLLLLTGTIFFIYGNEAKDGA